LLRLERLSVVLGTFHLAADLSVARGARVAVIGPSGGGKSTLLGAIGGFIDPNKGKVLWEGADLTALPPGERPVTTLFQDANLFPHLTVAQNVGLGIAPRLSLSVVDRRRVDAVLERVGLAGLGARRPRELSGGQQSRAALARALLRARPLFLLDEPFAALGPALRAEMLDLVAEVLAQTGATLLMVSHFPADALRLCPETIVVVDGIAHPPASTEAILADPPQALRDYLGQP
jgi:thiamine transport system ATP-binding protein